MELLLMNLYLSKRIEYTLPYKPQKKKRKKFDIGVSKINFLFYAKKLFQKKIRHRINTRSVQVDTGLWSIYNQNVSKKKPSAVNRVNEYF